MNGGRVPLVLYMWVHSVFSIYIPISLTGLVLPFASPMPPLVSDTHQEGLYLGVLQGIWRGGRRLTGGCQRVQESKGWGAVR